MQADWGVPQSGPVHDLLHVGDAVSADTAQRRPAPGLLTFLLKEASPFRALAAWHGKAPAYKVT